ncbi:site-specific DNA-methyltransferase [Archaeoglobales archaeon]|nr:MAG: site-specific DNA-methyltransferase [Archaeoglobales archaeon]
MAADELNRLRAKLPVNKIIHGDCVKVLNLLPKGSIDLVVTSPPYNVGKEYEEDLTEEEYVKFLTDVFKGLKRVLKPDGRICWNVPYSMISSKREIFSPWYCSFKALRKAGLKFRDNITWNQLNTDNDTAWGSWCSASAPWVRHMTEAIIVAYKETWKKQNKGETDLTRDEFLRFVLDLWGMPVASKKKIGHPAPFPEELPYRCIKLFSFVGDVVLDPFLGSGTTALVAVKTERRFIGIELKKEYCEMAARRIEPYLYQKKLIEFQ